MQTNYNFTYDIDNRSFHIIMEAAGILRSRNIPVTILASTLPEDPEGGLWYLYTFHKESIQPGLKAHYNAGMVAEGCYDAISVETDDFARDIVKCVESHYYDIVTAQMNEERIP